MRKTFYALLLPFLLCSCSNKDKDEEIEAHASRMVNAARDLMLQGNYPAAKDSILTMRERYPKAFKARATGIVVIDSIELLAAKDTLALMDSALKQAQDSLAILETQKRRGHNAAYYKQRTHVFHLKQHFDEIEAKVKFYLRKIEIDIRNNTEESTTSL